MPGPGREMPIIVEPSAAGTHQRGLDNKEMTI
jgi:hypothetical protein